MIAILAIAGIVQAAPWTVITTVAPTGKATVTVDGVIRTDYKKIVFQTSTSHSYTLTRSSEYPEYKFTKVVKGGVVQSIGDGLSPVNVQLDRLTKPTTQSLTATLAIQKFAITSTPPMIDGIVSATFAPAKKTVKYDVKNSVKNVFKVTPKKGYAIDSVSDNGNVVQIYANSTATTPVAGDRLPTIDPVYVIIKGVRETHALTAVTGTKGTVNARITPTVDKTYPLTFFTNKGKVNLNASTSFPTTSTYQWSVLPAAGATLTTAANGKLTSFTAQEIGSYTVTLAASSGGVTDTTSVNIYVTNKDAQSCVYCHNSAATSTPASPAVVEQFLGSEHNTSKKLCDNCHGNHTALNPAPVGRCVICHSSTDPGFSNHSNCVQCHNPHSLTFTGNGLTTCTNCHGSSLVVANFNKSSHSTTVYGNGPLVCTDCHSPHNSATAYGAGTTGGCQTCHTAGSPYGIYDANMIPKAPHGGGVTAPTAGAATTGDSITQYLTQGAICSDCHGHNNSINAGFAEGGHGKVSSDPLNAWTHYNWAGRTNNGTRQNGNCDRCHTAVGFIKLLGQDPEMQTRLALNANAPNNVLICIGCHKTAEGELRTDATPPGNPTPLTGGYFALFSSSAANITAGNTKIQIAFPGYKNSSICIPCHSGRSTDKVFIETIAKSLAVSKNYTTISTSYYQHAANMAQTFIGTGGYDFTGKLALVGASAHNTVKMNVADTQGPCVGCHFSTLTKTDISNATHTFEVNANSSTCSTASCHNNSAPDVATAKANFDAGVAALDILIRSKFDSLRTNPAKPLETERINVRFGRFGKTPGEPADATTATKAYGAWYNWQILATYDKAAYTHNPTYAHQLLIDTGNYLLNPSGTFGQPNFSAYISANAGGTIDVTTANSALAFINGNNCASCHTDTKFTVASNNWSNSSHKTGGVYCVNCHNPMTTVPTYGAGTTGGCQTCHTAGSAYGIYSSNLKISAKHYNANVGGSTAANIASYVASDSATNCNDCHGHNNVINAEYAKSGHGDLMGPGWEHYDFAARTTVGKQDYVNGVLSSDCNRCHTTTGYNSFVASGFKTLSSAGKPAVRETLYCNGCHTSAEGALKTVAAFVGNYNYNSPKTGVIHLTKTYTNWNESNACVPCHSGRGSAELAKSAFAFSTFTSAVTPFALHHAQPAGLISGYGAYNFTSGDFAYQDRMRHMRIGVADYNGTGSTQGPCVGCHFTSEESHSLEVVTKDATSGDYTGIISETCKKCHPTTFTYQDLNTKKAEFNAAVKVLGNLITSKGLTNNGRTAMKWFKTGEVTRTAAVAEKNMGAFINYNIVTDADKALWLHNPALARRIVFDSIDWLDDSILNSSAVASIYVQSTAGTITTAEGTSAVSFTADPGCLGCHFGTAAADGSTPPGIQQAPHYNTTGALVPGQTFTQAQFVVPGTQCNNCHGFGHGTDSPGGTINKDFAESNHGNINGLAWTDYDFKTRQGCVQCHTTTGFVKNVGMTFAAGTASPSIDAWGTAGDTTKQVLGCNTCHSSTTWNTSIRNSGAVTAPMGVAGNTPKAVIAFADVSDSNVCILCHSSRENGESLIAGNPANSTTKGFTNPHYLGAAAVFYGKGGFQFYSSGVRYNTYGAAGKIGKTANWSHGKLGMDNYSSSGNNDLAGKSNNTGTKGQCVACHLGPDNTHTFGAAEVANTTMAGSTNTKTIAIGTENGTGVAKPITRTCYGCHQGNADSTVTTIEAFIDEEKENWYRMFDFFKWQLEQYGITYTDAYPYFNNAFGATVGTTFGGPGVVDNNKTRGAAMNLKLLLAEKGSHVHNRSFGRALIADSITYLQKGDVGNRSIVYPDQNQIIKFSDYSSARPTSYVGQVGPDISISTLKSYLTRTATGGYTRR